MFALRHFYVLLDAYKDLVLVDNSDGEIVYDGMMGSIPDEYDDCEVTDFGTTNFAIEDHTTLFFEIEVNK